MSETFNDAKFSYLTKALGVTSGDIDDLDHVLHQLASFFETFNLASEI